MKVYDYRKKNRWMCVSYEEGDSIKMAPCPVNMK